MLFVWLFDAYIVFRQVALIRCTFSNNFHVLHEPKIIFVLLLYSFLKNYSN